MSVDDLAAQVGTAWGHQRDGDPTTAIQEFEKILKQDSNNIDALYGLGLAQRAAGQKDAAIQSFQRSLDLVLEYTTKREEEDAKSTSARRTPNTSEDDRYMMLRRMLLQRIDETKPASSS